MSAQSEQGRTREVSFREIQFDSTHLFTVGAGVSAEIARHEARMIRDYVTRRLYDIGIESATGDDAYVWHFLMEAANSLDRACVIHREPKADASPA